MFRLIRNFISSVQTFYFNFSTNKTEMATSKSVSYIGPKSKRPLNEFLFKVVNGLSLEEFIKFTNFPDIMEGAIIRSTNDEDRHSLGKRIQHIFEICVPDQIMWLLGLFNNLTLKREFYESDVATRIFSENYGTKECTVNLVSERFLPNVEEQLQQLSQHENSRLWTKRDKVLEFLTSNSDTESEESIDTNRTPIIRRIGPKSVMKNRPQSQLPPTEPSNKLVDAIERSDTKSTAPKPNMSTIDQPECLQKPYVRVRSSKLGRTSPESVSVMRNVSPGDIHKNNSTSSVCEEFILLKKNFKRSIERACQHLIKYFDETDPKSQSIEHFWMDFVKSEYDRSAAVQPDVTPEEKPLRNNAANPEALEFIAKLLGK